MHKNGITYLGIYLQLYKYIYIHAYVIRHILKRLLPRISAEECEQQGNRLKMEEMIICLQVGQKVPKSCKSRIFKTVNNQGNQFNPQTKKNKKQKMPPTHGITLSL